jgi:predicted dehydrogenase
MRAQERDGQMRKTVKLGIVGVRMLGQWHVECVANLDGVEVAAVADSAETFDVVGKGEMSLADYAASIGAAAYTDGADMIENADIDAVSLCVSPKWREPLMVAAAKRKLPANMEKPMACDTAHGEKLAKIAADAGIMLMMEYPLRYFPAMKKLKSLLGDGLLGKPLSVTGELQTCFMYPKDHWTWDPKNGNGFLNESITHLYDTMCFICGTPVNVYAKGGAYKGASDMADAALAMIEFENGSYAAANGGAIGTTSFKTPMYVHVFAENGEARVTGPDWMYDSIEWATTDDKEMNVEKFDLPHRRQIMIYNLAHFAACVRDGLAPSCDAEDGLNCMRIVDGLRESMATGNVVELT